MENLDFMGRRTPPKFLENRQNHMKMLVFVLPQNPPCGPYIRAVILDLGNILGMLPKPFSGMSDFHGGAHPPPNCHGGMKTCRAYAPACLGGTPSIHKILYMQGDHHGSHRDHTGITQRPRRDPQGSHKDRTKIIQGSHI